MHHPPPLPRRHPPRPQLLASLKKALTSKPPDGRPGPVVIVAAGSELRSDDAVGPRAAALVAEMQLPGVRVVSGGPAPENATGEIRALSPSFIFIVDAADMNEPPGTIRVLEPAEEAGAAGAAFATHGLPLGVLAGYLRSELGCPVTMVGIQPESLEYGEGLSPAAERAAAELADAMAQCIASRPQ